MEYGEDVKTWTICSCVINAVYRYKIINLFNYIHIRWKQITYNNVERTIMEEH